MIELAQANNSEIAISQLAEQRSKNADVQAFAKKMIDDHTQASNDLQQLAQQKGVKLPETPDAKHQAMAKELSRLSAEQFDRQYMARAGTHDHQSTKALLERIRKNASDPDLRALADKVLPVVEEHLQAAKEQTSTRSTGQ
ncbi:MAG: DUF4142 domain-containing protein [Burkholderiales bacterium]|nr:DUF4142 domain-containing protein [Burkholderiales bacterium]